MLMLLLAPFLEGPLSCSPPAQPVTASSAPTTSTRPARIALARGHLGFHKLQQHSLANQFVVQSRALVWPPVSLLAWTFIRNVFSRTQSILKCTKDVLISNYLKQKTLKTRAMLIHSTFTVFCEIVRGMERNETWSLFINIDTLMRQAGRWVNKGSRLFYML